MDPIRNPYAPGAGTGRLRSGRPHDEVRENARIALERTKIGRPIRQSLIGDLVPPMVFFCGHRCPALRTQWPSAPGSNSGRTPKHAESAHCKSKPLRIVLCPRYWLPNCAWQRAQTLEHLLRSREMSSSGATRSERTQRVRRSPESQVSGHRGWPGLRSGTRSGRQRRLGDRFAGLAASRRRSRQGRWNLQPRSSWTRSSM